MEQKNSKTFCTFFISLSFDQFRQYTQSNYFLFYLRLSITNMIGSINRSIALNNHQFWYSFFEAHILRCSVHWMEFYEDLEYRYLKIHWCWSDDMFWRTVSILTLFDFTRFSHAACIAHQYLLIPSKILGSSIFGLCMFQQNCSCVCKSEHFIRHLIKATIQHTHTECVTSSMNIF